MSNGICELDTEAPQLCADNTGYVTVRLPSGEQRLVLERCMATIGSLSNAQHKNRKLGRAGASRWLGRRPTVRGVAMNSVDHPHGGGRCASTAARLRAFPVKSLPLALLRFACQMPMMNSTLRQRC